MKPFSEGVLAEFETSGPAVAAAERLRAAGYERIVAYLPYEVPELTKALDRSRTALPAIVLIAGIVGALSAYWLQWYTAVAAYPLDAGGRPAHAGPAFILITFETTVLFAACAGFVAWLLLLHLPRLWAPESEIEGFERATIDRFWIGVAREDGRFDAAGVERLLRSFQPLRTVLLEGGR